MSDDRNILFCKQAWQYHYEKMKSFIAEGETNPMRILGRYHSSERIHPVVFKNDGTPMPAPAKLHNPFNFDKLPPNGRLALSTKIVARYFSSLSVRGCGGSISACCRSGNGS
jgi:hypothetical protein